MSDIITFSKNINSDTMQKISMNFHNQHILTYNISKKLNFCELINCSVSENEICYYINYNDDITGAMYILNTYNNTPTPFNGKKYIPNIKIENNILNIHFNK